MKISAYPELIGRTTGGWKVADSLGSTPRASVTTRELFIPMGNSPGQRYVRQHELVHIKISPDSPGDMAEAHGVSLISLLASEDARVTAYMFAEGLAKGRRIPRDEVDQLKLSVKQANLLSHPQRLVRQVTLAVATGGHPVAMKGLDDAARECVEKALAPFRLGKGFRRPGLRADFDYALRAARIVDDFLFPRKEEQTGDGNDNPVEIVDEPGADSRWGEMKVEEPNLLQFGGSQRLIRRQYPSPEGEIPIHFDRALVDGAVFTRSVIKPGGNLLIDASGSMGLSAKAVRNVVSACPGVKVAMYMGRYDPTDGILRIVAHKGRIADQEDFRHPHYGENVVDYPALKWLARQKGPKIWYSDGHCYDANHRCSVAGALEIKRLCRQAGIRQIAPTSKFPTTAEDKQHDLAQIKRAFRAAKRPRAWHVSGGLDVLVSARS